MRASIRTLIGAVLTIFGFITLLVWGEYSSWQSQVARTETDLVQSARALVQHADDTLEMAKLPLAAAIAEIQNDDGDPELSSKLRDMMKRQIATSSWLDRLSYVDVDGRMVATSADVDTTQLNFADREYFKFHQASDTLQPILGIPIKSRLSPQWVLTVSQRVNRPDGSFGGVVTVVITMGNFSRFFENFDVGSKGTFLMVRGDGMVLSRSPQKEDLLGTSIISSELFTRHLKRGPTGAYHYTSPIDREARIGGFYKSDHTGLIVLAAASQAEALDRWIKMARIRWMSGVAVVAIAVFLVWRWRRQVTLRRASEALLRSREAEFRLLAEGSSDLIQRFSGHGVREYVSPSAREVYGIDPEALIGTNVMDNLHDDDREHVTEVMERLRTGSARETLVARRRHGTGKQIYLETTMNRLPGGTDNNDIRIVAVTRDITRQRMIQEELDALANTDELTQLANRRSFNSRFEDMVKRAERERTPLSLLMIDADRFKLFNDSYGHAAGDECLRAIATAAVGCIRRSTDLAARYGGEELAILLPNTDAEGAMRVAESIRRRVFGLGLTHEKNLPYARVTISIGTATLGLAELGVLTSTNLFDRADRALYQAKSDGRNRAVATEEGAATITTKSGRSG